MVDRSKDAKESVPLAGESPGDRTTLDAPPRPGPAVEFEGYQILEEFPRGGQALVFKALHKATKSKVALKVLPPGMLASAKARHLFEREVDLISALEHPNIVHIRDSGIAGGQYYFAMEYIRGRPLDEYVAGAALPPRATMELLLKVCAAVAHAHQRGVIHRDLKPSNILVDERGEPHLLDFGLAKSAGRLGEAVSLLSVTGEIKGTLLYMSPEQAAGRSDAVDTRSDVYSLGVVFYQVLTREFPYDVSGTTIQTLHHIQFTDPVRPRNIIGKFDRDLETILLKALAKDPSQRYHSAAELGDDIRRWLQDLPIHARSSTFYIFGKFVRRHALQSATLVLGLLSVIIGGFLCTSYGLCRAWQAAAEENSRLADDLTKMNDSVQELQFQLLFEDVLDLWQKGQYDDVVLLSGRFPEESRERRAIEFLLKDRPLAEKAGTFRRDLGISAPFFTTLVLAEHYLRDGDRALALKLFQQLQDQARREGKDEAMLQRRVTRRLTELTDMKKGQAQTGDSGR